MGAYENFIKDFPSRCNDLLSDFSRLAEYRGREVTLMLSLAASGLIIPYERLKAGSEHPSSDRRIFEEAAKEIDKLSETPFLGSAFWNSNPDSWRFGKDIEITTDGINVWALDNNAKPLSPKKQSKTVIGDLRNALAHGNIFTRGNPIETLIFITKPHTESNKFNFYMVSPNDFKKFLSKWFDFIESMRIPDKIPVGGTIKQSLLEDYSLR